MKASSMKTPAPLPVMRPHAPLRLRPVSLALAGLLTAWMFPAQAMLNQVTYEVVYDGTEDFNLTRTGPGFDADNKNGIVRTHDDVGYQVTISSSGPDQNPTIRLTLPQHNGQPIARWKLPTQCLKTGSDISPDGQTVTCRLADLVSSGTQTIPFDATVLGHVRNGTLLNPPTIAVTSTRSPGGVQPAVLPNPITVTAAPFYDVRVQMSTNGSPPAYGASAQSGPPTAQPDIDPPHDGVFHRPMIGVFARNPDGGGKKGVEQLDSTQPLRIDLDLRGYPNSVKVVDWHADAVGSYRHGCGSAVPDFREYPSPKVGERVNTFGKITDTGPANGTDRYTVANGGSCSVLPGTTRETVSLSLTGVNTLLEKYPVVYSRTDAPIPSDEFWVANKALVLWSDLADYPHNVLVNNTIRFASISGTSISGQAIPQPPANPAYHADTHQITSQGSGTAQKSFIPDKTLAAPLATQRDPAVAGDSIVNYMAPSQTVTSILNFSNPGTTTHTDVLLCDILDRSAFDLAPHFSATVSEDQLKNPLAKIRYSYGARPAGQSPYFSSIDSAPSPYELIGKSSSHGNGEYSRTSCNDADIRWFDTWQEAEQAGGLVYVRATINQLRPSSSALLYLKGLRLRETWASTVNVLSPKAELRQAGQPIPAGTLIRNRAEITSRSFPMDVTLQRDHLLVVPTRTTSRVTKVVTEPASATTSPVPAGSYLTYQIQPTYSTLFPQIADTVTITDILPKGVYYQHGSAQVGGQDHEPDIQENTPAAGMTTLTWRFPDQLPHFGSAGDAGARMPPITFRVRLSNHLANDTLVRNLVSISGGANDYEADCRYNATGNTLVMTSRDSETETSCLKGASVDVRVKTPAGVRLEKSTSRSRIEPGDPFDYSITFISMGQQISRPNIPDLIDVLPFVGDGDTRASHRFSGRNPASRFDPGAWRLLAVTLPDRDRNASVYYTSRNPGEIHNDPSDASNLIPGGSTRWCLEAELGSAGCPASIGDSTAIRISPSIALLQANVPYEVKLSMASDPVRAYDGNIFANHVGARSPDLTSKLHYVESQADLHVRIVQTTGGLSGRIFTDITQNNVFDGQDGGLSNQCVKLEGTNSKGQTVLLSTRTDAEGRYAFTPGLKQAVFHSADCTGAPLPHFGGLLDGTYGLTRLNSVQALPGGIHAGSQGGSVDAGGQRIHDITLASGALGTDYNFTEQPVPPRLTLISTVTNDHGGTASIAQLPLSATLSGHPQPNVQGASGTPAVTRATVPAGELQLSAPALPGYRAGPWQCTVNGKPVAAGTSGSASAAGDTGAAPVTQALKLNHADEAVCSIHYDDEPARLTLQSTVTNSNGRTATPQDFVLHAQGPATLTGVTGEPAVTGVEVLPGTYELREDELPNYVAGAWHCNAGTLDGSRLTLANGEHATCTINNTDQPVSLTLVLDVINEHGGTATERDTSVSATGPDSIDGISGSKAVTVAPVRPGVYKLTMPTLPGYRTGKWVCSGGTLDGDLLTIGNQQNITCRIQLKDIPATLKATKSVLGQVQPVAGSSTEYQVQYRLTVKHEAGAAALYALTDTPAFDPDVQILGTRISRNGRPLPAAANDGSWRLADQQRLAIGAEDVYLMDIRLRVPYGSNTTNNRCAATGTEEGRGLFNRLSLINQGSDADPEPVTAHACIDTPVPADEARLAIEKRGSTQAAELGDLVNYQLRIRNHGKGPAISPVVVDRLPAGFRLEPGSVRVQNARAVEITQGGVRELRIRLERVDPGAADRHGAAAQTTTARNRDGGTTTAQPGDVVITYSVRLGVGSQEGDGTNRVHVECLTPNGAGTAKCSNESRWKVQVRAGIFSEEACVVGQVFVDCNGNSSKDAEELGIPGVRLYLQNGTWMVTDSQGKYSHCGLRPRTHVLKIDGRTLPRRSRLVTSSAQNSGDAESLFIDARKGMLHRADFIEGSCSATVIEQVKARQAQGENSSVQTEVGQPALTFESKRGVPARPMYQGTDAATQSVNRTRH